MMQLFYTNSKEKHFTLNPQESKHAIKVLRKKEKDIINFTNGEGRLFITEILIADIKKTKVKVIKKEERLKQHKYYLHIAIAPTKNIDRFEWFLEKACEIGIDEITPIICSHSERKIIKQERCNRILLSAMKQSLKFHKPKLNKTINLTEFLRKKNDSAKYIAHCGDSERIELKNKKPEKKTLILIGPEGDFSLNEINIAMENEFKSISLSKSRLRTETAGIVAVNTINLISND
jgi:16S rRNA (uracil1498-N3)-methyltransferase